MRADMYVKSVLAKCDLFSSCALWPREPVVRPRAWLNNFDLDDQPIAAVLLDHFVYFSSGATDQLLVAATRELSSIVRQYRGKAELENFHRDVVFCPLSGEHPNPTDSGQHICRKARQVLSLPDEKFVSLAQAHQHAAAGKPIVLIDDFLGSGDQMISTWRRESRAGVSFATISDQNIPDITYVALVGTVTGRRRLADDIPTIRVVIPHLLDEQASVRKIPFNPLVPDIELIPDKIEGLLEKYKEKLNLPSYLKTCDERKLGYSKLGLLVAFEHSVPDATLPIIWGTGNAQWTPLAKRS